jgi:hypothetical protein
MFVRLDFHKKYTEVAIVNEEGVVEKQERIENEPEQIEEFSNSLSNAEMVLESSSTWYWLYEILSRKHKVLLSNPAKTQAIASAMLKTDKVDALMLANLLRGDYIAESYLPSRRITSLEFFRICFAGGTTLMEFRSVGVSLKCMRLKNVRQPFSVFVLLLRLPFSFSLVVADKQGDCESR